MSCLQRKTRFCLNHPAPGSAIGKERVVVCDEKELECSRKVQGGDFGRTKSFGAKNRRRIYTKSFLFFKNYYESFPLFSRMSEKNPTKFLFIYFARALFSQVNFFPSPVNTPPIQDFGQ